MDVDLKFDYLDALRRQNFTQSEIDLLRDTINAKKCDLIPNSLTNKQVNIINSIEFFSEKEKYLNDFPF